MPRCWVYLGNNWSWSFRVNNFLLKKSFLLKNIVTSFLNFAGNVDSKCPANPYTYVLWIRGVSFVRKHVHVLNKHISYSFPAYTISSNLLWKLSSKHVGQIVNHVVGYKFVHSRPSRLIDTLPNIRQLLNEARSPNQKKNTSSKPQGSTNFWVIESIDHAPLQ